MESESESKSQIQQPVVITLSKPPPRSKMSKEKTFQIFTLAALLVLIFAILLRCATYLIHFLNFMQFFILVKYIIPSLLILEALITIFYLPCFVFKNGKPEPLENLIDGVKRLTKLCIICFVLASFNTIFGVGTLYYIHNCKKPCPQSYSPIYCKGFGSEDLGCFAHPALVIVFVLLSTGCMWAAGLMYLGILIMFFGKKVDKKVHPQGPQEATTVEQMTPQESTKTDSTNRPSTSPIVPETINQAETNNRLEIASPIKGKPTKKARSKESHFLLLKVIIQIVLSLLIIVRSVIYWLDVFRFFSSDGKDGIFFLAVFLCAEMAFFAIFFSIMFWRELLRIALTLFKVWEPLGKDVETEKTRQRCNATTCFVFFGLHLVSAGGGIFAAWICSRGCKRDCIRDCTNACESERCKRYRTNSYETSVEEKICGKLCSIRCEAPEAKLKQCCAKMCPNLYGVIAAHIISIIAIFVAAMMFRYIGTFLKKNGQPPPPEAEPVEGQDLYQNSSDQEIKPVEEQPSEESSQE